MDFFTLSLPEAMFLYDGLALQGIIRATSLRYTPIVIALFCWGGLLLRSYRSGLYIPATIYAFVGYPFFVALVLILFWPDGLPFGRATRRVLTAAQVGSYVASRDAGAQVVTAEETGQVPAALLRPIVLPEGTRLLLRVVTETPLALARAINDQTHRPFASLQPMHWLLGLDLTADVTTAIADWVHACYLPVLTTTMAGAQGRTIDELLPWRDQSLTRPELAQREVVPGSQTGITWLRGPNPGNTVRCDVYLEATEFRAQTWLFELRSPRGTPLTQVFAEELGLDSREQARFLIYREILRAAGPAVPAPSLTGTYALLRGAGIAGRAAAGGVGSGVTGWLSGAWAAGQTLLGIAGGTGAGIAGEFQRAVDGLSWIVGVAVFLTWWGPYIVGIMNLVLLTLLPFDVLWMVLPHNHLQPLLSYIAAMLFVNSSPLWWALIDQIAKLARAMAPQSDDVLLGLGNGVIGFGWEAMLTVLATLLVPVVSGFLFFRALRSLPGLWRGTV